MVMDNKKLSGLISKKEKVKRMFVRIHEKR